jgi:prepilin-type N-terminal cleavage/methylation domain-containing protein
MFYSSKIKIFRTKGGFTLLELLLAVGLLALVSTVTYFSFSTFTAAWQRGVALAEDLHHADFVMEQLTMALRSAYYPDVGGIAPGYGFELKDEVDGEPADEIAFTKIGSSLIGRGNKISGTPHRIKFTVGSDESGRRGVIVKYRPVLKISDKLTEEEQWETVFISDKVVGFNCRAAYRMMEGKIEWLDEWKETNRLPTAVEITLYMKPLKENDEPVELKRAVGIPVAPLSWR